LELLWNSHFQKQKDNREAFFCAAVDDNNFKLSTASTHSIEGIIPADIRLDDTVIGSPCSIESTGL
jgi:hypothetical protein